MVSSFVIICSSFGLLLCSCKKDFDIKVAIDKPNTNNQRASDSVSNSSENRSITSIKTFDFLPFSSTNQVVKHHYYAFSYNEKYEQADWVAYELKASYLKNNNFKRPFFIQDIEVKTESADWKNYKKTSFDKGHFCPADDMEFDLNAYNDTFLISNISPQDHNFNNGV